MVSTELERSNPPKRSLWRQPGSKTPRNKNVDVSIPKRALIEAGAIVVGLALVFGFHSEASNSNKSEKTSAAELKVWRGLGELGVLGNLKVVGIKTGDESVVELASAEDEDLGYAFAYKFDGNKIVLLPGETDALGKPLSDEEYSDANAITEQVIASGK